MSFDIKYHNTHQEHWQKQRQLWNPNLSPEQKKELQEEMKSNKKKVKKGIFGVSVMDLFKKNYKMTLMEKVNIMYEDDFGESDDYELMKWKKARKVNAKEDAAVKYYEGIYNEYFMLFDANIMAEICMLVGNVKEIVRFMGTSNKLFYDRFRYHPDIWSSVLEHSYTHAKAITKIPSAIPYSHYWTLISHNMTLKAPTLPLTERLV